MQHGDPFVKSLVRHTLNLVSFKHLGLFLFCSNPNGLEEPNGSNSVSGG